MFPKIIELHKRNERLPAVSLPHPLAPPSRPMRFISPAFGELKSNPVGTNGFMRKPRVTGGQVCNGLVPKFLLYSENINWRSLKRLFRIHWDQNQAKTSPIFYLNLLLHLGSGQLVVLNVQLSTLLSPNCNITRTNPNNKFLSPFHIQQL